MEWSPMIYCSDALPIFTELLLSICTTIIKLFIILACIITTWIDPFTEIQSKH